MEDVTAVLQPQDVLHVLQAVSSGDLAAEGALRSWEQDAQPGFFHSRVSIIDQPQAIAEARPMPSIGVDESDASLSHGPTLRFNTQCCQEVAGFVKPGVLSQQAVEACL